MDVNSCLLEQYTLLGGITQLLGNTLALITNLLDGLLGNLLGLDLCTGWLLGSETNCKQQLANHKLLTDRTADSTINLPNILLPLLGSVVSLLDDLLSDALNALGTALMSGPLEQLGLHFGQVETTLISLNCEPDVRLVH